MEQTRHGTDPVPTLLNLLWFWLRKRVLRIFKNKQNSELIFE
jgi:hypothetical protein